MFGEVVRGELRRVGDRNHHLVDARVAGMLDQPFPALLHIAVTVERSAVGDDLVVQVEEPVFEIPDAGRLGVRHEIDLRMIDVVHRHRIGMEGVADRLDDLVAALGLEGV